MSFSVLGLSFFPAPGYRKGREQLLRVPALLLFAAERALLCTRAGGQTPALFLKQLGVCYSSLTTSLCFAPWSSTSCPNKNIFRPSQWRNEASDILLLGLLASFSCLAGVQIARVLQADKS